MPSWTPACLKVSFGRKNENGGGAYSRQVAPDEELNSAGRMDSNGNEERQRGTVIVELNKKERTTLGLIISGGVDKGSRPKIANLRPGSLAYRSDSLCVGDVILSVNGIRTAKLKHEEIVNLLKNAGDKVMLEVEYDLPYSALDTSPSVCSKVIQIRLEKENGSFGFVLRGGVNVGCPLTVTYVRPGSPADREGTMKSGDRLLAVDNHNLVNANQSDVTAILRQIEHEAVFTVEYDVSLMEAVRNASGPLLVEIERGVSGNQQLGIALAASPKDPSAILIQSIKQASLAERCGALHVGDQVLAIDGVSLGVTATAAEASQLLRNSCGDRISLEILPLSQMLFGKRLPEVSVRKATSTTTTSLASFATLGSNYRCQAQPVRTNVWRPQRGMEPSPSSTSLPSCVSSCSVAVAAIAAPCSQVCRTETTKVTLSSDHRGFGLALCVNNSSLSSLAPPIVGSLDPGGAAERSGVIQVGDRILAINGVPTEGLCLEEVTQMIAGSKPRVVLHLEFDVAESVVPSSGVFEVRLPRKMHGGLGINVSANQVGCSPGALVISEVRHGSVAHRTGTIQVGDRLLAIGSIKVDDCNLDEVHRSLRDFREEVVRLKIQKGDPEAVEEISGDDPDLLNKGWVVYTVELSRRGNGPLGVTVSGSDEPFRPVVISALSEGGLAERTGTLQVGDQLLAIDGHSIKGRTLGQVIQLLQNSVDSVSIKVARRLKSLNVLSGDLEETDEFASKCGSTPLPSIDSAVESWDSGEASNSAVSFGVRQRSGPSRGTPTLSMEGDHGSPQDVDEDERPQEDAALSREDRPWPNSPSRSSSGEEDEPDREWIKVLSEFGAKEVELGASLHLRRRKSEENLATMRQACRSADAQDSLPLAVHSNTLPHGCSRSGRSRIPADDTNTPDEEDVDESSPYPIEVHRVTLFKDSVYEDFGFSVSDGLYRRGVYVNRIRPGGPADIGGILKPFDRILQVNDTKTHDFDCCLTVPLIAAAGDRIHLVVVRNPYTGLRATGGRCGTNAGTSSSLTAPLPWMEEEERESIVAPNGTPLGPCTIVKSL